MKPGPGSLEVRLARHAGLICNEAQRYVQFYRITMGPCADFDDLLQEYRIAALRALRNFDPSRGFTEGTYIHEYLHRKTLSLTAYVRRQRRTPPTGSIASLDYEVSEGGETLADLFVDEKTRGPEEVAIARLSAREYLGSLSGKKVDRMQAVIVARARGATLEETAFTIEEIEHRPISRERIRQIEARAIKQIRKRAGIAA